MLTLIITLTLALTLPQPQVGLLPAGALDAFRALLGELYLPLAAAQLGDGGGSDGAGGGSLSVLQVLETRILMSWVPGLRATCSHGMETISQAGTKCAAGHSYRDLTWSRGRCDGLRTADKLAVCMLLTLVLPLRTSLVPNAADLPLHLDRGSSSWRDCLDRAQDAKALCGLMEEASSAWRGAGTLPPAPAELMASVDLTKARTGLWSSSVLD